MYWLKSNTVHNTRTLLICSLIADEQANAAPRPFGQASTAVKVDAIVSTIGFPLVGGPAGTMEGGRQADIAKAILSAKNVPYFVAAPLLIQDIDSWTRDGVAGLQSVVLYSLPELDGAIDTVPLGGLVRGNIFLIPERVKRLSNRIKNWVDLRCGSPPVFLFPILNKMFVGCFDTVHFI